MIPVPNLHHSVKEFRSSIDHRFAAFKHSANKCFGEAFNKAVPNKSCFCKSTFFPMSVTLMHVLVPSTSSKISAQIQTG